VSSRGDSDGTEGPHRPTGSTPKGPRVPPPPPFPPPRPLAGSGASVPRAPGKPTFAPPPAIGTKPGVPSAAPRQPAITSPPAPATPTVRPPPSLGAAALPPPPEFLPRAHSIELPLENAVTEDTAVLVNALEVAQRTRGRPGPPSTDAPIDPSLANDPSVVAPIDFGPGNAPPLGRSIALAGDDDPSLVTRLDLSTGPRAVLGVRAPVGPPHPPPAPTPSTEDAGLGDEVDIDVSEDTLPRLALREPYPVLPPAMAAAPAPSEPWAPSQVPTAPVPVVPVRRAQTGPIHAAAPAPRRALGPWLAVGAALGTVLSIVALVWVMSSSEPAPESAPDAPAKAPPDEPGDAGASPARPEPTPAEPAPAEPAPAEPAPAEPAPSDAIEAPPADERAVITVTRDRSAYERAAAEHARTGSASSLLAMAIAACELDEGPRARAVFRKLVGRAARTKAMVTCRAAGVDVTSTVDGYTGGELLAQARAALAAGDAKAALDKAHASNKVERSSEAVLVKGLAACSLGDADQAQRLLPHVSVKARARLVEGCAAQGITLRP
jgi:hypothetical protein